MFKVFSLVHHEKLNESQIPKMTEEKNLHRKLEGEDGKSKLDTLYTYLTFPSTLGNCRKAITFISKSFLLPVILKQRLVHVSQISLEENVFSVASVLLPYYEDTQLKPVTNNLGHFRTNMFRTVHSRGTDYSQFELRLPNYMFFRQKGLSINCCTPTEQNYLLL